MFYNLERPFALRAAGTQHNDYKDTLGDRGGCEAVARFIIPDYRSCYFFSLTGMTGRVFWGNLAS